ncbi:mucin-2 [Streptomyces sp. BBFR2]|uniref:mucin-2 n=1 Tax=Streptomyces sp. BBFR2 TaxID=3372854 RepID=UPI0037DA3AB0
MLKAGNAAIGLWMRAGAYAAQHLTEGAVPGVVAQLYGTAPQTRKLVASGLWHEHGHACPRCPQPPPSDFQMHDFLAYNPTRASVEDGRQKAAERQQRARVKAAGKRRDQEGNPSDSSSNRGRIDDDPASENLESSTNRIDFPDVSAGQGWSSQRDGVNPSRSPRPGPAPLPPTEVELASYAGAGTTSAVPANARPLRDALTAAGIVVEWNLPAADWFRLEAIIKRTAVAALVDHARGQWQHARSRPRSVRYFLPGWSALPPVPAGAPTTPGADVIPLAAGPRRGRVAAAADMFAAALATTPKEPAQ